MVNARTFLLAVTPLVLDVVGGFSPIVGDTKFPSHAITINSFLQPLVTKRILRYGGGGDDDEDKDRHRIIGAPPQTDDCHRIISTSLISSLQSVKTTKASFSLRSVWLSIIVSAIICTSCVFGCGGSFIVSTAHAASTDTVGEPTPTTTTTTTTTTLKILSGTVINPTSASTAGSASESSSAALYITARPNTPDNVPVAILSGTRGKTPPVMAARFPQPTFPFKFDLVVPDNLTAEGGTTTTVTVATTATSSTTTTTTTSTPEADLTLDNLWWSKDDLLVSVRLDQDGVASTRSPDDLVGRGLWRSKGSNSNTDERALEIRLEGRGTFGKMVTGGR